MAMFILPNLTSLPSNSFNLSNFVSFVQKKEIVYEI